ncbi:DJ-1/PfpI family protein [Clostridium omnivorum]|uniref:4-methyl-5(B-hydroxyethyl)-thiazole monophosphate biosynthesis protein n=1 Tax=Clostridium omnivorum TaxID=1604902 RepID=A0ABQ5N4I7_9CLOT|nr:DJ-1/PfpI family protein [Clostridium sp. E14]GLC30118.1 4-methyl-5(B-hydroxyethyl)-thiazole monophosphate biosynthesis protein [Clostridium sp. E14]
MKRIFVFIYDDMADFEITFVTHMLGADLGMEIVPISYEDKLIRSKSGVIYKPSKLVKDVLKEEAEGLIIPGGWNGEMRSELIELIQSINSRGKLLGAICAGPRFLAKAGVLDNVKYTTSIVNWTETHEKNYMEDDPFPRQNFILDRVIRDGNIITAQGNAFIDFAIEIVDWFGGFDDEEDKNGFAKAIRGIC